MPRSTPSRRPARSIRPDPPPCHGHRGDRTMDWSSYEHLAFSYPSDGVLLIKFNRPERFNAMNPTMHTEVSQVWLDVDRDPACRVAVITGAGRAFSAGGDFDMVEATLGDYQVITRLFKEAADIVHNITAISKPVISAINATAVGAGLALALVADISIIAEDTKFTDRHHRIHLAGPGRGPVLP